MPLSFVPSVRDFGSAAFGEAAKANDVRGLGLALAEGAAILLAFLHWAETTRVSAFLG